MGGRRIQPLQLRLQLEYLMLRSLQSLLTLKHQLQFHGLCLTTVVCS
jgi:hypothetical protein